MKKKIIVTGGSGRFGKILKKQNFKNFIFPNKKQLNILKYSNIENYFKKKRPKTLIHLAGLSRPLARHEKNISESINLNIIGTCNLVKICEKFKIKLIYFSTSYVYPGKKGNYKETDPLLPINNYAWSKLGGEAAVQMYKNSLIIRACMTEEPFIHKFAFDNVKSNFIFHKDFAEKFIKVLKFNGIINIGGKTQTIYQFAKKNNKLVKKIKSKGQLPLKMDMNTKKYKRLVKR